jgi:hypothetical protein
VRPSRQRPSTTPNSVPCKKKLRGCGHCGWLATRLITAARQNRTRHGERQQGVHHVNVHGSLATAECKAQIILFPPIGLLVAAQRAFHPDLITTEPIALCLIKYETKAAHAPIMNSASASSMSNALLVACVTIQAAKPPFQGIVNICLALKPL